MTDGLAPAPVEVELKYRMSEIEPGQRLLAADGLAGLVALGPPADIHVEDRYIDTPDAALAEAGYAGRLRTGEAGTIITLKGLKRADAGGAAHRREEAWKAPRTRLCRRPNGRPARHATAWWRLSVSGAWRIS